MYNNRRMSKTEKRTPAEPVYMEIGSKIAMARKSLNMTQQQLAEKVKSTRQAVAMYEAGERRISIITLIEVSKILKTDLSELIPEEAWKNSSKK